MSDYIFYGYLVGCFLALIAMIKAKASFLVIISSSIMYLLAWYLFANFALAYVIIGLLIAFLVAVIISTSEAFQSKNRFFLDMKDVFVSTFMVAISCVFWMQIICINIHVDANNVKHK